MIIIIQYDSYIDKKEQEDPRCIYNMIFTPVYDQKGGHYRAIVC